MKRSLRGARNRETLESPIRVRCLECKEEETRVGPDAWVIRHLNGSGVRPLHARGGCKGGLEVVLDPLLTASVEDPFDGESQLSNRSAARYSPARMRTM